MKHNKFLIAILLFIIHCSLFTASAQSWQELMDSTNYYQEKQDFETALKWGKLALEKAKDEFREMDTNYIASLGKIAVINYYLGKIDSSIYYQAMNLKLCRLIYKDDHPELANSINNMAEYYKVQGRYEDAKPLFIEGLEITRRIYIGRDNPDLAISLNNLAGFYYRQEKYKEAEPFLDSTLAMYRRIYAGKDHPALAATINNMAVFYDEQGRYKEAELLYEEALAMRRRIYAGKDHPALAASINNIAVFYDEQVRYKEAEPLYEEALAMRRRIYVGKDHPALGFSINNIARFYYDQGRYEEAEPLYEEALAMRRRIYAGKDHPALATSIEFLALFYNNQGRYKEAEPLYDEALAMCRRIYTGKDHPVLSTSICDLALFYYSQGRYKEAESLYDEALAMCRRIYTGKDSPALAASINNKAGFYYGQGKYKEAEPLFNEALAMCRRIYTGRDSPALVASIYNMAGFYYGQGRYKEAEPLFIEALHGFCFILNNNFHSLSEKEKEKYWNTMDQHFETFNSFVSKRVKDNPSIVNKSYNNQLIIKGMLLNSTQKIRNNIINSNDEDMIRKYEEWLFQKGRIAKLYSQSKEQLEKKGINLDSIINDANAREKELSRLSEDFAKEYQKKKIEWQDVQKQLKPNEVAIEIVRFRYFDKNRWTDTVYYGALILTSPPAPLRTERGNKNPIKYIIFKNGNDLEDKYLQNYFTSIIHQLEDKDSYNQYWKPIADKLKGIKKVYLSVDGVYNQINLATLMNPKTEHYLSDDLDIRVVTSTRDLVERHTPESPLKRGKIPLNPSFDKIRTSSLKKGAEQPPVSPFDKGELVVELFGDPMFNLDSTKHLELANAIAENRTREFYYLGNTLDSSTRGGIMPLPSTRTEIEQIANEFTKKGWKVNSHLGEKALEEAVKGVDNPKVLHIATHGKFLKDVEVKDDDRMLGMETKRVAENPLLRTFLLFSGAENTLNDQKLENQNTDDGLLTAYEAMNLNLDKTDLVVLSACETGLGEIKNGEGVYGLQRAFQQAGAKSIIMSLWTVPDKETQELMTSFYTKWLNGKDKRTAFNEARNEMRDKYHYPYYWGGFVMVGE